MSTIWNIQRGGDLPLVTTAIHDGHAVRHELEQHLAISDAERLREEDPFTAEWTAIAGTRIIGLNSRFEVDLNRPRTKAVYQTPEDAWGLKVWKEVLSPEQVERSLAGYDAFYRDTFQLFSELERRFQRFVVFDLHSYNHRRSGPDSPAAEQAGNPDVNIGTGSLDSERWGPIVARFMKDLQSFDFGGQRLDVRENVKFTGGQFSRWTHQHFPDSACVLAIEVKKIFMDEWTGALDRAQHDLLRQALTSTVPGVLDQLQRPENEAAAR